MLPGWLITLCLVTQAYGLDDTHRDQATAAIHRGIGYLLTTQGDDGSWSPQVGPAITALALGVMLDRADHPGVQGAVDRARAYVLSKRRADGGIHDGFLENYNTAICLSALARVRGDTDAAAAVAGAQAYLTALQWHDQKDPKGNPVTPEHPYYGGAGYGKHGRPDLSNTQIMLQGLYDSGLAQDSPAFERALTFIARCQGTRANDLFRDRIQPDGGFIYATSLDADHIGQPQSMAGDADTGETGQTPRLRTYGSMTYAGFKSYLYANLDRDDPRVADARGWIAGHYTLDANPGMPEARKHQGLYYYYMTFAQALGAWGEPTLKTDDGEHHDWANDLIEKLCELQLPDGSWVNPSDRWMEGDPNLVTCYALIALTRASD